MTHPCRGRLRHLPLLALLLAAGIPCCPASDLAAAPAPALPPPLLGLRAGSPAPHGALGSSVAMDLDTAVVGAPGGDGEPGAAYVFTRALTGEWHQQAQLAGQAPGDGFGTSVAVAGERALVGTGVTGGPAAYVFARSGETWRPEARLPVGRGTMSVALSPAGDRAVIGVSGGSEPLVEAAYVFVRADGGWAREAVLGPPPGTPPGSGFGWSVAVSEELVAVGAQGENGGNGAVHVFEHGADGRWRRQARLSLTTDHPPALFGWSVALADNTLMVGAFGENSFRGAAYLFGRVAGGAWSQQARLVPDDLSSPHQCFGFSVALSLYGALIGQPCDGAGGALATHAYLFSRDAQGAWSRRAALSSPQAPGAASFGAALATNGLDVVIGSPGESEGGVAYVLECLPCLLYGGQP
jgi:hypothetical protein